jgi:hypothetical protein
VATRVPPGAERYIQYLPQIAGFTLSGRQISGIELGLLQGFAPDAYQALRSLTYEELAAGIRAYANDPRFGEYVRLALSTKGEQWIRDTLRKIHGR